MKFTQRARGIVQAIAVVLSLAVPLVLAISSADARVGGGSSSGSRGGANVFRAAEHLDRAGYRAAVQPHHSPSRAAPEWARLRRPAAASSTGPACGMLGGLAAGFLGAGLLGMLFGGGMFGGLGGLSSIFGLILQIGLIMIVVRLAMSWWQRRHATASAYAGAACRPRRAIELPHRNRFRTGLGQRAA